MKRKNKHQLLSWSAENIGLFSKIVICFLVFAMIFSSINVTALASIFKERIHNVSYESNEYDLSSLNNITEVEELRSENTKTYLKENGMFETEYYAEQIHYLKDGQYQEIDNTLISNDEYYYNNANSFSIQFPKELKDNEKIVFNYNGYELKLLSTLKNSVNAKLSDKIDRKTTNLKDEISYQLSENSTLQYIVKQNSLKENIILSSYTSNFTYIYHLETDLRIEKVGNELFFYDGNIEVFTMSEYIMYDAMNNPSKDIDFTIKSLADNIYEIVVTPSDDYLRNASYPVIIDPEIRLSDGGLIDGICVVTIVDPTQPTPVFKDMGSFTINNNIESNQSDDIRAYLHVQIPQYYDGSIIDRIIKNQFMYANITLPTTSTNASSNTKVNMRYVESMNTSTITNSTIFTTSPVDSQEFHNSNVFDHQFDIYDIVASKFNDLLQNDLYMTFELKVSGANNTSVTYSLGYDLGGDKPLIKLGYMDEAGLADYYTYENLPISNSSNAYIAHNSGNLTYVYNDFSDNSLLNLSHIFNTNRMYNNSSYGNGFSLSYNEKISTFSYDSKLKLTEGNGRVVLYNTTNSSNSSFIATDGSGDKLDKIYINNSFSGYEIETSSGILKQYNENGMIVCIYTNVNDRNESGVWSDDASYITLEYDNDNFISKIMDNNYNYIDFYYSTYVNTNPQSNQINKKYLSEICVYKYDPTKPVEQRNILTADLYFEYIAGNLIYIYKEKYSNSDLKYEIINLEYNTSNHISKIEQNGNGYCFTNDTKNRITKAKIYSVNFVNGDYLDFAYDTNGKKTIITDGEGKVTSYTFDGFYHTNSISNSNGYTTFYKYQNIFFNEDGTTITSPNYYLNHKIIVQSNSFRNTLNPITNHGFEIISGNGIYGWTKELTYSSTAAITNLVFLYGSKVLELHKTSSGVAKIYQEVNVESDETYIVSGYIKNSSNLDTGAYIEAVGVNGTFSNIQAQTPVKNTKDFVRYEYKFTSNYTGTAKIYLINESVGDAYFDQIQIKTNYNDMRYNYLNNASFEDGSFTPWNEDLALIISRNADHFDDICGNKSLKLFPYGEVTQYISLLGEKDDTFIFGGYCFYENYKGKVDVSLTINYSNLNGNPGGSDTITFTFDDSDLNARYMMSKITAAYDYTSITLTITNDSIYSYAELDNFAIYKEGYGLNLSYTNSGLIEEEYNEVTDESTTYTYDANNNLSTITTNTSETTYSYDSNQNLNSVENQNVTAQLEVDENENIESINATATGTTDRYEFGSTTYTSDGLFHETTTDALGNVTSYTYDYVSGLVKTIIDDKGFRADYTYDANGNVISLINGTTSNSKTITYTYDTFGHVTSISTGGVTYYFTYNNYNDIKTISIGESVLVTNTYTNENSSNANNVYTGKLTSSIYSYGTISFDYYEDDYYEDGSVENIYYNDVKVLSYIYNDYGEVSSYTDYKDNVTYYFNYDYQNRLINVNATNGNNITYSYDENSHLVSKTNINGTNNNTYTDVNPDLDEENNVLTQESISGKYNINYSYSVDAFANLETISYYFTSINSVIDAAYTDETTTNANNETVLTGRVSQVEFTIDNDILKFVYEYDDYSNITKVTKYLNNIIDYYEENTYDIFNQLVRQDVLIDGTEYRRNYTYDTRGNIISYQYINQTDEDYITGATFQYRTSGNKDELVFATINGYNYTITYSSSGQPNLYLGWQIGYDMRNITTLENSQYYIEYSYNANNIRTGKYIYNGVKDNDVAYILDGNKIIRETRTGDENYVINYYYDSSDNVIGFEYNNNKYLYLKNLQNDIIGIVDEAGNLVVEYTYDAYGNIIKLVDTSNCDLSTINPFRYRSYYYDKETGWYYLNSRYYNPIIGRFITMDSVEYLGASGTALSMNLFSYCENNPIINIDPTGHYVIGAFIEAQAAFILGAFVRLNLFYDGSDLLLSFTAGLQYQINISAGITAGFVYFPTMKSVANTLKFSAGSSLAYSWGLYLSAGGTMDWANLNLGASGQVGVSASLIPVTYRIDVGWAWKIKQWSLKSIQSMKTNSIVTIRGFLQPTVTLQKKSDYILITVAGGKNKIRFYYNSNRFSLA